MYLSQNNNQVIGHGPNQNSGLYIPNIIEQTGRGERFYDIFSRLLRDRIIFIGTPVDDNVASIAIAQMLFLQMEDPKKDINLYINSPGGSVTAGLAIYDTMQFLTCDVATYCIGICASMGAFLLCAGAKGKRYALPNSDIMIHQVSGGAQGTASDVERTVEFMFRLKKRLIRLMALHAGKSEEQVRIDSDRDYYMSAEEACKYGIVDHVVESRKQLGAENKPELMGETTAAMLDAVGNAPVSSSNEGPSPSTGGGAAARP